MSEQDELLKVIEPIIVKVFEIGIHTKGDQATRTATILWGRDEVLAKVKQHYEQKCPRCNGTGWVQGYAWRGLDRERDLTKHREPCPLCKPSEQKRLDRPVLIKALTPILDRLRDDVEVFTILGQRVDTKMYLNLILALIPDIEEADALREIITYLEAKIREIITYLEAKIKEAKEQFREWGFSACPHNPSNLQARKAYCPECWQILLEGG